jgi:DnaJ-class molecular chaperone
MTDEQWEAQNGPLSPGEAAARGLCWQCTGNRVLYTAFGGVQRKVPCRECRGTGKAKR